MKFVCVLFRYFYYGGLSRDMLKITNELIKRGHSVSICVERWDGELPKNLRVCIFRSRKLTNHGRAGDFVKSLKHFLEKENPDVVIGFNKMPYLDFYFAADVCYASAVNNKYKGLRMLYGLTSRYRTFLSFERDVFDFKSKTKIMFLDISQKQKYNNYYRINEDRCLILPPAINDKCNPFYYSDNEKEKCRRNWGISDNEFFLLQVGSDFKRKGVDRSIRALASLPEMLRKQTKLIIVGEDSEKPFMKMIKRLKLQSNVFFTKGLADASLLIASANILLHPARVENTGTVIVEALATGTPVITTMTCGFSHYVNASKAGMVISNSDDSLFSQEEFDNYLLKFLSDERWRAECIYRAKVFSKTFERKNMQETAVNYLIES